MKQLQIGGHYRFQGTYRVHGYALVDDEDFAEVGKYRWSMNGNGYVFRFDPVRGTIYLSRQILKPCKGKQVDHINGNKLDNRRENLRAVTPTQNLYNRGKMSNNTSGYKGVYWQKNRSAWRAYIKVRKVNMHLGYFNDKLEAVRAYNAAAKEFHGMYARLNPI